MTTAVIAAYLALVLVIGALSHRLFRGTGEDFFLATRTIGPFLLLMSLFGTHMTAFALLGASGEAYHEGIGVFALMASSSAIVVPAVFLFLGPRLWALGKANGFLTQAEFFRVRFQSGLLGLAVFVILVGLLVPYLLIGVMGGGLTLASLTDDAVPAWLGSAIVCAVVLAYVTVGGLRGTAWANAFQTLVFMTLGVITFAVVTTRMGGLPAAMARVAEAHPDLLVRGDHIAPLKLLSYTFIPLSAGMFPHLFMHWLSARSAATFRLPLVFYPLCIAVVWLPSVLLGTLGSVEFPGLVGKESNSILVEMIGRHAPAALAGLLAAGVVAAIMSSLDSQVLALGTMFTHDVVRRYRTKAPMTEAAEVRAGRWFVAAVVLLTWGLSLVTKRSIFKLGVWSFTGFAALVPLVVAALYWRRATRAGAFAGLATVAVLWLVYFRRGWVDPGYTVGGSGLLPVAVIVVAAALAMVVVSLLTKPPDDAVLARFFDLRDPSETP